jgi:hypothetical protein
MIEFEWQPIALMLAILTVAAILVGPRRRRERSDVAGIGERKLSTSDGHEEPQKLHGL